MKHFDIEFKKYAEKVRLKAAERRELRERILSYMEYHPLPKKHESLSATKGIVSESFTMLRINVFYARIAAGVFALILVVGVPLLAERSLPGDALYLVKTQINEGIRAQFADSPYEKVAYETTLIERRIAEARLLASEGRLTEEVGAKIAETVKGHADAAQSGIAELKMQNADDAAIAEIALDSALEVQSAVLDSEEEGGGAPTDGIRNVVNTAREEVVAKRGTTTPSFEGLSARIELETTRAYELFTTVKESATEEEIADIERRLSDIDRKIVGAKEKHEQGIEGANSELASALGLIQKLITFMTDIDVRNTIELEDIVPVELTIEERVQGVHGILESVKGILATVIQRTPNIEDESILEKVSIGTEQVQLLVDGVTSSLEQSEIDETALTVVEGQITEAQALIGDLDALTKDIVVDEGEMPVLEEEQQTEDTQGTTTPELPPEENASTTNEMNEATMIESESETT